MEASSSVSLTLNGRPVVVEGASALLSLNDWLRAQPGLTGTKKMCGEGGCGCCVVAATLTDPIAPSQSSTIAINSCLCPLYSVNGWGITTVEGIGSSTAGFHPVQERIAEHNGSQCGYCTPGFVMSMYSLLQRNPKPTKREIEDEFDGNICRCTGYRPILDAMKTFAVDSDSANIDIEDLGAKKVCPKSGSVCRRGVCGGGLERAESGPQWFRPTSLAELAEVIAAKQDSRVKLVAGDTGRGIFKTPEVVDVFIDLKAVPELLKRQVTDAGLVVGGTVTLTNLIALLQTNVDKSSHFVHLADHLLNVASVPVRNIASVAGNLMLCHKYNNFPSDLFTILAAAQASITLGTLSSSSSPASWSFSTVSLWEFLKEDMSKSVIVSITIPFAPPTVVFRSYKVMPRAKNAHAYVNAAFWMDVRAEEYVIKSAPTIVYGGIGTHSITVPEATLKCLEGQRLLDPTTLNAALSSLEKELAPNTPPAAASVSYRKALAMNLFYKFYLAAVPENVSPRMASAALPYVRPVSEGTQVYSPNPAQFPVTQPMTKLTAKLQASGEAQYTTDIPALPNELAGAFVLTTKGNAKIASVDISKAEKLPGFVKVLTAADIPPGGQNNFRSFGSSNLPEEVLAKDFSEYAGQAVAVVLADTEQNAAQIARAVTVQYTDEKKPILTLKEAIEAGSFFSNPGSEILMEHGEAKDAIEKSAHVIKGEVSCGTQYHFTMETQVALCIPEDDSYTVHCGTQWTSSTQFAVAAILGIPASSVDVYVKRIGGAYGAKITRASQIAAACALGAHATRRPVRMHLDIDTNMKMVGKRFPYLAQYTVGATNEGMISGIDVALYTDCGWSPNDSSLTVAIGHVDNAYYVPNWLIAGRNCKTNTPANTYCRSPGTVPGIFIMESMIDHLAKSIGADVEAVRKMNLYKEGQMTPSWYELPYCNIDSLWEQLYQSAAVGCRKEGVAKFNEANRWRKRGLSMVPLKYFLDWSENVPYTLFVSVYASDGTVAICHGGVEIGQGINTKVAQVAAKVLGIPIELIKIKPSNVLTNPNASSTGGSMTSELTCLGTIRACNELLDRMKPVRDKNPDLPWKELVLKCFHASVDLSAKAFVAESDTYNSYGVACTEVEIDILTGQTEVLRVDILFDCGDSLNPEIDIGQIEGAFTMGLGYWLSEKISYDQDSGKLLTHNTWEYKPPSSKDIPVDFRVELLKNVPNPIGVLGSKASGEPPQCMSCCVLFALKRAIESAQADIGIHEPFILSGPATVEDIQQACMVSASHMTF